MKRLRRGAMLSPAPSAPPPVVQMFILGCRPRTAPAGWPDAGTAVVSSGASCLMSCYRGLSSTLLIYSRGNVLSDASVAARCAPSKPAS